MSKVSDITEFILSKYPLNLCADFDLGKVGLQFGSPNQDVKKVMICLDGQADVVNQAIQSNADLLICHHPFMWTPMLNLNYDSVLGKKLLNVFDHRLNVFAMHTNFDTAMNGMNDYLGSLIGLKNVHAVNEIPEKGDYLRIGEIEEVELEKFAEKVKKALGEEMVRFVGDPTNKIKKVAIIGGGGGSSVMYAKALGADCYISGEFHHNNAIDAIENDISLIEVSHFAEANFKKYLIDILKNEFKDVEFVLANESCPFNYK